MRQRPKPQGAADQMRDYVVQLRKKIQFTYTPIRVKGIGETAQPFLMWRNKQYATNRTNYNRAALRVEGEEASADELQSADQCSGRAVRRARQRIALRRPKLPRIPI